MVCKKWTEKEKQKMKIKEGGSLENFTKTNKMRIEKIVVVNNINNEEAIHLWINDDVLSFLDIVEAIKLRNELNTAIKRAAGI